MSSKKPLPGFASDEEAEAFVATADLTEFDLTGSKAVRYEFQPKGANISMRLPDGLLEAVKNRAAEEGMPYQRYVRQVLEDALAGPRKKAS